MPEDLVVELKNYKTVSFDTPSKFTKIMLLDYCNAQFHITSRFRVVCI